jgi:hypothetical protein
MKELQTTEINVIITENDGRQLEQSGKTDILITQRIICEYWPRGTRVKGHPSVCWRQKFNTFISIKKWRFIFIVRSGFTASSMHYLFLDLLNEVIQHRMTIMNDELGKIEERNGRK